MNQTVAVGDPLAGSLELTILMPCLNEAETVEVCVRKAMGFLKSHGVSGEVVIADNGSTDGSQALAIAQGARVVPIPEKGYGAALIGGIEAARGRYVIMGDSDDSYDFENLGDMLAALRRGDDLVMGNRFKGGIKPGAMPILHRWLGNPVLSFLGRLFFNIPVGDFHCGLRGFSRRAILDLGLRSPGMEFASEMVVKARLWGLKITEVPATLSPDGRTRAPHLRTWRDGWRHLRFLLLHSPRWLFYYPGLLLVVIGLLAAGLLAGGALQLTPNLRLDIHTLVVACFAIQIGLQFLLFGALSRQYAVSEGFLPPTLRYGGLMAALTLETVLRLALVLLLGGLAGAVWAVAYWASLGWGDISYDLVLRVLIVSMTAIATAIQTGALAFFASVFSLRK